MNIPQPGPPRTYHFPRFHRGHGSKSSTVILATLNKLPLVTVTAIFPRGGAAAEVAGHEGIAQLTAAMLLEGTSARDGAAIADAFERLGSSLSVAADWDCLSASVTAQRDRIHSAVALLRDVLHAPAFRDADLARLKGEHESARLQLIADPRTLADAAFAWSCYQASASRFRKPINGTLHSVQSISRDDVVAFWSRCGGAEDISVIVAGDATPDDAARISATLVEGWPAVTMGNSAPPVNTSLPAGRMSLVERAGAAQAELRIGHRGVPRSHPDYFELTVMNAVLGGLFSSRINLNLREQHGYTYGAFSGFDWRVDAGPWAVSTAVKSEVTAAAIREITAEIGRIRHEPITTDELELATKYLIGVFPLRFETTSAVSAALSSLVVFGLPEDYFDTYRSRIAGITPADVQRVAHAHLHPESLHIVVAGDPAVLRPELASADVFVLTPDDVEVAK